MDRHFNPSSHIVRLSSEEKTRMSDGRGGLLEGIFAQSGIRAYSFFEMFIGMDRITMEPGSAFEPHIHPGDHILYIVEGEGAVVVDGVAHRVVVDDVIYIPAESAHGVSTVEDFHSNFVLLAFGVPHKPADAIDRMTLVADHAAEMSADSE